MQRTLIVATAFYLVSAMAVMASPLYPQGKDQEQLNKHLKYWGTDTDTSHPHRRAPAPRYERAPEPTAKPAFRDHNADECNSKIDRSERLKCKRKHYYKHDAKKPDLKLKNKHKPDIKPIPKSK